MTTRPNPKQLATGTPEDGYSLQYSSGDSIWTPGTNSVFGRTGDVVAGANDYSSSQIDNDSSVTGEQVSDALEYLDGYVASVADDVTAVSTMTVNGDLSGTLPNPTVTDLTIASEEQGSVLYFNGSNWVQLPPGEDGYVLTTHGTAAPTWEEATSGSGGTGTPFTVVTVTEETPVELAIPVSLPESPSEGDMFRVGYAVEYFATQPAGGLGAGHVYVWGVFEYSSAEWWLTNSGSYRSIAFDGSNHSNSPYDLSIWESDSPPPKPERRFRCFSPRITPRPGSSRSRAPIARSRRLRSRHRHDRPTPQQRPDPRPRRRPWRRAHRADLG